MKSRSDQAAAARCRSGRERPSTVISDVGEAAVFRSDSPLYATATAFLKGRILVLHLHRPGRAGEEGLERLRC